MNWLKRLFQRDEASVEKRVEIDHEAWERLRAITIDPRAIAELVMLVMSDEPPLSGMGEVEFVVSAWASVNPTLARVALEGPFKEALPTIRIGAVPASWGTDGLTRAAPAEAATLMRNAESAGRRIGVGVQVKEISRLPSGTTGPRKFCILTVWGHDRPGKSPLVITDQELLPDHDGSGRPLLQFREK